MFKNNKFLVAAIITVFVLLVGVIVFASVTGKFHIIQDEPAPEDEEVTEYNGKEKHPVPSEIVAVVYNNFDVQAFEEKDGEEAEGGAFGDDSDFVFLSESGFNTVIFDISALNNYNVDAILADYSARADACGMYSGIYADLSLLNLDPVGAATKINTDFVILGGIDESAPKYDSLIREAVSRIAEKDAAVRIGLAPMFCTKIFPAVDAFVSDSTASFIYLTQSGRSENQKADFRNGCENWSEKNAELWLFHDLSGLDTVSDAEAKELIEYISESSDIPLCKAVAFGPFSDIFHASSPAAKEVLDYVKERENYLKNKEFTVTNHDGTNISVNVSTVTFRGTSSPEYDLTCNGEAVERAANGDFSIDCKLNAGSNRIVFAHKDKEYVYNVNYKIKIIKSVSPSSSMTIPGGMTIEVSATALKGSSLTATISGKSYPMTEGGSASGDDDSIPAFDENYSAYSVIIVMPQSKDTAQNLGRITVTGNYNGVSESMSGASVTISADIPVAAPSIQEEVTVNIDFEGETTEEVTTAEEVTDSPETTVAESTTYHYTPRYTSAPAQTTAAENESTEVTTAEITSETTTSRYKYATATTAPPPTKKESTTVEEGTTAKYKSSKKYSPYKDNGLGTATICEIIDDYVEVYNGNSSATYSVPSLSPLLKGTFDYVTGEITLDGSKYYILKSGVKVPVSRHERLASGAMGYITHTKVTNAYVLPSNSIRVIGTTVSSSETKITLDMNWKVPFNCELTGQSYSPVTISGNLRNVGVNSLNCKGLKITFFNTSSAEGRIANTGNSVISSGSWSKGTASDSCVFTLTLANAGRFYGYTYYYDSDDNLVISVKQKPSSSLSGYTIMLDPGHGGIDPGASTAVSATGFTGEKTINLSIAKKVKELLEAEGANVIMTRNDDSWVCYTTRNDRVRKYNPDMFISIHCDSSANAAPIGTSAYYYTAWSQPLAKAVHTSIVNAYKSKIYVAKGPTVLSNVDRGTSFYAFRVARVEQCPAILIEYGFVSNTMECQTLQNADNRNILAQATVEGIKNYIANS